MDENLRGNYGGAAMEVSRAKHWPIILITAILIIFAALIVLILVTGGKKESAQEVLLAKVVPQALTEGEKLVILNQLNSGGGSVADRQSEVNKLAGSASTISLGEKQNILNNLVGSK